MATYFSIPAWEIPWTEEPGGSGGLVAKLCPTLETPWTIACQAPLSMGFSRQKYLSGHSFLQRIFPDRDIEPRSPALQAYSLLFELQGSCTL